MKRRNALKMVAAAVGGLVAMPTWASNWTAESLKQAGHTPALLTTTEADLLAEIAETIIPATKTEGNQESPGARALNINQFIEKMVADCYDKSAQDTFRKGLTQVDEVAQGATGKPFLEGDATQRLAILSQMSQSTDATQKGFLSLVKNLTIRGYMTSEYVMTNLTHFEMAPARYKGCVPVKKIANN